MQGSGVIIAVVIISAGGEEEGLGTEVPSPAPSLLPSLLTDRQDASARCR